MNTAYIPTPQDAKLLMENAVTKTATFVGTTLDLGKGYAPGGVGQPAGVVVQYSALDHTTGDETYTLQLTESSDDNTYTPAGPIITLVATVAAGTICIPGFVSKRYVRLALVEAGTSPSLTYSAWLNPYVNPN